MTIDKKELFEQKIKEIDNKLYNLSLTDDERQVLVEKRSELEEFGADVGADIDVDADTELDSSDAELYGNEELDEYSDEEHQSIYFKYCFEGCNNITEVLSTLNSLKEYFEQLSKDGHELFTPVSDGYCFFDKIKHK